MQLKRFVAGAMGFLMAGSTMAFAAGLDDLPQPFAEDGNVADNALVVVGSDAKPSDIVGGINIAARLGSESTDAVSTGGSSGTVSVSGGQSLDTKNSKLYGGDAINSIRDTLTSTELSDILASGTVTDDSGTTYDYDQYIDVGSAGITFGKSGDLDDPVQLVEIGTAPGNAYTAKVNFNDAVNMSDSDVQGNTIELFGKDYTIGTDSSSSNTNIQLFGSANTQTLDEGDSATVEVDGTEYDVSLVGITSDSEAVVTVDGTTKKVAEGNSIKISGLDIYSESIFYFSKEGQSSTAKLSFGSSEIWLQDGNEVQVGSDQDAIDGTNVKITESGEVSSLEVEVAADDSDYDHVAAGESFVDTVFGTFELAFNGLDGSATETFELGASGDTASLSFADDTGADVSLDIAYQPNSGDAPVLQDSDGYDYTIVEGQKSQEDDYVVLRQGGFSRVLQVSKIRADDSSDPYVRFKDIASGNNLEYTLDADNTTDMILDGQTYYVNVTDNKDVTVNNNGFEDAGDSITVFPTLETEYGAEIALVDNVSVSANTSDKLKLPGGGEVSLNAQDAGETQEVTPTGTNVTYTVLGNTTDSNAINVWPNGISSPGVLVLEEEREMSGADQREAYLAYTENSSTDNEIEWKDGGFTDGSGFESKDNDDEVGADIYGTAVTRYIDSHPYTIDIEYPDNQLTASVAIGPNPTFSTAGGTSAQTINEAVALTTPLGKLDSDVTSANKNNKNMILVGGPAVNSLVEELASANKTETASWYREQGAGTALIDYVENAFNDGKSALVVAGHSASDTTKAAEVVQQYDSYSDELSGSEAVLKVSDGSVSFQ